MNGVLVCEGDSYSKNIGDFIQSVAQEQYWDHVDCYVERESLDTVSDEGIINVIMNGWFMWQPNHFPPSKCINPFFISFHLVPSIADSFFTQQTIKYLKEHEPIGARDYGTQELMEEHGIKSYYSSCLTLTLGEKYKTKNRGEDVYFVDPYYAVSGTREFIFNIPLYIKNIIWLIKYHKKVRQITTHFETEYRTLWGKLSGRMEKRFAAAAWYAQYHNMFDDDILLTSQVITHTVMRDKYPTVIDMMEYARILIKKYAAAKLVITSRIHCALPCLALDTPVIYVQSKSLEKISQRSPGRMKGILNFFNIINWDSYSLNVESESLKAVQRGGKINGKTKIKNGQAHLSYAQNLKERTEAFVSSCANKKS